MGLLRILAVGLVAAASAVPASLLAKEAGAPQVRLAGEAALVESSAGATLFMIRDARYLASRYGNKELAVFDGDALGARVRVTPFDQPALWIDCRYLAPPAGYCQPVADPPAPANDFADEGDDGEGGETRGFSLRRPAQPAAARPAAPTRSAPTRLVGAARPGAVPAGSSRAAIPECPGDPRCP